MKKSIWRLALLIHPFLVKSQDTEFKDFIQNSLKTYPNCEIAIGIVDGDEELKLGYSIIDGKPTPVDNSSTLFEIGSISKTFIAALFSKELRKGSMLLDDPVQKHLSFKINQDSFENHTLKMKHLVTHTSGLKKNPLTNYKRYSNYLRGFELDYVPGINWEYNNLTVALLAQILIEKNNKPWPYLLRKEILDPLIMQRTFVNLNETPDEGRVQCVYNNGKTKDCYFHKFKEFQWPAGGIVSNIDDMMKWLKANIREEDANLDFLTLAHNPLGDSISIPLFDHYKATQGIIWQHYRTTKGERIVCHGGITPAQTAFLAIDKKKRRGIIVLANVNGAYLMNEDKITKTTDLAMSLLEQ